MDLTQNLRAEHALIEQVVGALQTFVARRCVGGAPGADGEAFLRFLRGFVGGFHHEREEQVLFPALVAAELPGDRGPVAVMRRQHEHLARILDALAPQLTGAAPLDVAQTRGLCSSYAHGLWAHIDAENTVLFPESEERLARSGVLQLPEREPGVEEVALRREGERLVAAYPPAPDPLAMRGEGCVVCPAYGSDCDGLEREWWSDQEWEEFSDRVG